MKKSSALGMGLDALFEKNDVFDDISEKKATEKIRIHLNYYADLFPKLNISEQDMQNNHFFCDGKRIFEL